MKYLRKTAGGWRYSPPKRAIRAGVVDTWIEEDGRTATLRAGRDNKRIRRWQRGEIAGNYIDEKSSLAEIAGHYMSTSHFQNLKPSSQTTYRYLFRKIVSSFGGIAIGKIDVFKCNEVYDEWIEESIPNAKMLVRCFSLLINHAIAYGVVKVNPMVYVKKVAHRPDTKLWSKEEVEKFLDTAFSKWEWRNVGIMFLLCYEFAQRPIDIAHLKWENVDFDKNQITIHQSKRGATVYVPMSEQIKELLLNQYQDFSFQEYVAPGLRTIDNAIRPYTHEQYGKLVREIAREAGLPDDLKIGKLRNTAITEMVEAGVDIGNLKQVTGHANIQSLNPYIKNTLKGATTALDKRRQG